MNDVGQYTRDWWVRVLAQPEKLTKWLQKLQLTEIGGHDDHIDKIVSSRNMSERTESILLNIARDELRHSGLLLSLMRERGIKPKQKGDEGTPSYYWDTMNAQVVTLSDYCAVNYCGESIAADRFSIIHDMEQTPADIKEFIRLALPDEIFHRETLKRLAGEDAIIKMMTHHMSIMQVMLK